MGWFAASEKIFFVFTFFFKKKQQQQPFHSIDSLCYIYFIVSNKAYIYYSLC